MVIAPKKIRPAQVIDIFATIMKLEYPEVNLQISIVKNNVEFTSTVLLFDQVGSRMMQLQVSESKNYSQIKHIFLDKK